MRILVVEDEPILLRQLTRCVHEALPEAEIEAFFYHRIINGLLTLLYVKYLSGVVTTQHYERSSYESR